MNTQTVRSILMIFLITALALPSLPARADDNRTLTLARGQVIVADYDGRDDRYSRATYRHDIRHSPPYGKAHGYYGKHKHLRYERCEPTPYRRYPSGYYAPQRYYYYDRHGDRVGVRGCIGGHDGYFCFSSRH